MNLLADPLFWFAAGDRSFACFGRQTPSQRVRQRLEDAGVELLEVGEGIETE